MSQAAHAALPGMTEAPRADGHILRSVLPNGIRVLSEAVPGLASVAIGVWVENGSRCERKQQNGLAHFIEHLFFKGTARRDAGRIAEEIDAVGGVLNADTDREFTCYYAKVLGEHLALAVDLLTDIVLASRFDPEEIEREKDVVYEEIAQIEDTPDDLVHDLFHQHYWAEHPLARPVCGTRATVATFDREACLGFLAEHYRPNRIIVAAAGDVEHARLVDEIGARCEGLAGEAALPSDAPPLAHAGVAIHRRKLEQVQVCLGTRGITATDDARDALAVLSVALGDSPSSRLFQEVRERRGWAYSIDSFVAAYRDAGYLGISAGTRTRWVTQVVEIVLRELARVRRQGLGAGDLARAKGKLKGTLLLGLETADQRMERLALNEMYFGRHVSAAELGARIDAVDDDAVVALAERLFVPEGCALVLLGDVGRAAPDASIFAALG